MKIAVTYEDGNVFQHFGRTENFKIYEIENGEIVSSEVMSSGGTGHEALAYLLADSDVNVLICGGLGAGAQEALIDAGIDVCSGATGDTDEAVKAYLKGELESSGVNCDHHDHEEHEEEQCGGGCGGSCGGCGGCSGCHPSIIGENVGKTVRAHYIGTFNDGTKFDSSYDRGEPIEFECGSGMMIPGFDQAVANMKVGEVQDVHLYPEEAYGERNPYAVFAIEKDKLPGSEDVEVGQKVYLYDQDGRPIPVTVIETDERTVTFDANHELAGMELNFKIELVEIL